jgi:predicted TIM-barrel enzyme
MPSKFMQLFNTKKPIIGMIHLAGENHKERVEKALEELFIYQDEGIDAAIIEDYHGTVQDVYKTLKESQEHNLKIIRGVNILRNPYSAFALAYEFGAKFIQFDSVQTPDLSLRSYNELREEFDSIVVIGGVGFKYTKPTGNSLEKDLNEATERCEAIVTTGSGTGIETPLKKLIEYKNLLGNFPLIVGAGINLDNVYNQLRCADGAIVGSYFKEEEETSMPVDRSRVKNFMEIVRGIRKNY